MLAADTGDVLAIDSSITHHEQLHLTEFTPNIVSATYQAERLYYYSFIGSPQESTPIFRDGDPIVSRPKEATKPPHKPRVSRR